MTLSISTSELRNMVGFLDMDITMINNFLKVLDNPDSRPEDMAVAEDTINQCLANMGQLLNTVGERAEMAMPTKAFTTEELIEKRIIQDDVPIESEPVQK